jgi:hypothetical protein
MLPIATDFDSLPAVASHLNEFERVNKAIA